MFMKTLTTIAICLQLMNTTPGFTELDDYEYGNFYPNVGMIYEIDNENDLFYTKDSNGNLWQFIGVEDWEVGDIVGMIMADSNTDEVWDDVIMQYRYCGHIE